MLEHVLWFVMLKTSSMVFSCLAKLLQVDAKLMKGEDYCKEALVGVGELVLGDGAAARMST